MLPWNFTLLIICNFVENIFSKRDCIPASFGCEIGNECSK